MLPRWTQWGAGRVVCQTSTWEAPRSCTHTSLYSSLPSGCSYVVSLICCCCCLDAQSCLALCDPVDCKQPGSSVLGITQARIMEWVVISFSGGSSRPSDQSCVSCKSPALQAKSLPLSHQASNIFADCSIWVWWLKLVHVVEWNIVLFSILITFSGFNWSCLIIIVFQLPTILCGNYSSSSSLQPFE